MASLAKLNAGKASNYYYEKDPIFTKTDENGQDQNLQWHGKLAEDLGLTGTVNKADFENLLNAKDKDGNQLRDLSQNTNDKRVDAYDITFAAPKSVSLLALGGENNEDIINAHQNAVNKAMDFLEDNFANLKVGQNRETVNTGKMVYAQAQHSTARGVGNEAPDAHLHTHNVIMNVVQNQETGEYRALAASEMMKNLSISTEIYKSELAKELVQQGYNLEDKAHGFDIKMEQEIIDSFSSRKNEITEGVLNIFEREKGADAVNEAVDTVLQRNNVESATELNSEDFLKEVASNLGVEFNKSTEYLAQHSFKNEKEEWQAKDLKEAWADKLAAQGKTFEQLDFEAKTEEQTQKFENAKEALETAGSFLVENDAHFTDKELLKTAASLSYGQFSYEDLQNELNSVKKTGQTTDEDLKKIGNDTYTTQGMYKLERENEKMLKEAKTEIGEALMSKNEATTALKDFEDKNFKLTQGQYQAAFTVLTSKDKVITIQGVAGSGKTTSLKAINHALNFQEKNADVSLLAPTNKAVQGAIEESKIDNGKSFNGKTTAKFINDFKKEDKKEQKQETVKIKEKSTYVNTGSKVQQLNKFAALTGGKLTHQTKNGRVSIITKGENKGTKINEKWGNNSCQKTVKDKDGNTYTTQIKSVGKIDRKDFQSAVGSLVGSQIHSKKEIFQKNSFGEKKLQKETTFMGVKHSKTLAQDKFNNAESKSSISVAGGIAKFEKQRHTAKKGDNTTLTVTSKKSFMGLSHITQKEAITNKQGEVTALRTTNSLKIFGKEIKKSVTVANNKDSAGVIVDKNGEKIRYENVDKKTAIDFSENNLKPHKLMIVDESSMISAKDGNQLLKARAETGGKILMFGDSKQLQSIGAGNFFNQAKTHSKNVEMNQSLRQQTDLQKNVAKNARNKDTIKESFSSLKKEGKVHEIKEEKERYKALAQKATKAETMQYTNIKGETATKQVNYKNNLVVANTNAENKEINKAIRNELKAQGVLKADESIKAKVLVPQNINKKQAQFAHNYNKDDKVTAFNVNKLKNGQSYTVKEVDKAKNELYLKNDKDGSITKLDLQKDLKEGNISKFKVEEREFAKNDMLVVTKTDKQQDILNSERGLVTGVNKEKNTLTVDFGGKEKEIDMNKLNGVEHGYSTTTYKSQGESVDRVQMHINTEGSNTFNATHVALTRQKLDVEVFTNDANKATSVSQKEQENRSTINNNSKINDSENMKDAEEKAKITEQAASGKNPEEKINTTNAEQSR